MTGAAHIAHTLADAAKEAWRTMDASVDKAEEVAMGADGTPTTRADRILDDAVLEAAERLGVSVLSEESGFTDHGGDLTAVVDPLDGSRNAGRGIPFFCAAVGVGRDDLLGLEAGVVHNLVTGDVYAAGRGAGASLNGRPLRAPGFDPGEVMVAVIADSSADEVQQEQERRGHHIRDLGSAALEMCLVASGALDAFIVRKQWLRVIDIAAAALIVREAGGVVRRPQSEADLDTPFDLDVRTGVEAAGSLPAWEAVQ